MKSFRETYITLSLGVAVALTLLVAGCSKDKNAIDIMEGAITFEGSSLSDDFTRGSLVSEFVAGDSFGAYVYATLSGADVDLYNTDDIMTDKEVTLSSDGVWSYDGSAYWPSSSYDTHFFAYTPYSSSASQTTTYPQISYTMYPNCSYHTDLIVAAKLYTEAEAGVDVALEFEHALSPIAFQVKGSCGRTLTGVTIDDYYTMGYLSYDGSTFSWTVLTMKNSSVCAAGITATTPDEDPDVTTFATADDGYIMALPQTLPTGATVTISYVNTDDEAEDKTTYTKTIDMPSGTTWAMGTKYLYTITLSDPITIEIGDWNTVDPENTQDEVSDGFEIVDYAEYSIESNIGYSEDGLEIEDYNTDGDSLTDTI